MPLAAGVYWSGNRSRWHRYSEACEDAILAGLARNEEFVNIGRISSQENPLGTEYIVDLKTMQQINSESGVKRNIRVSVPQNTNQPMVNLFQVELNLVFQLLLLFS